MELLRQIWSVGFPFFLSSLYFITFFVTVFNTSDIIFFSLHHYTFFSLFVKQQINTTFFLLIGHELHTSIMGFYFF